MEIPSSLTNARLYVRVPQHIYAADNIVRTIGQWTDMLWTIVSDRIVHADRVVDADNGRQVCVWWAAAVVQLELPGGRELLP